MKIHNKRELQYIAIKHSAIIDSKDFMNIYRKFTSEPYYFMTIDTTLPAENTMRFRKNILDSLKMTLTDKIKILDDKIKANRSSL